MNLKNCKYMKTTEFRTRQLWLEFVDAVGIALEVIADSIDSLHEWFKKWSKKPKKNKADNLTLEMNFDRPLTKKELKQKSKEALKEVIASPTLNFPKEPAVQFINISCLTYFPISDG